MMELPNIMTERKFGAFVLRVVAYRKLTDAEMNQAMANLMRQKGWKQIPKTGFYKIISSYGSIDL